MYSFSYLEPVCCSMSSSNCCFLTCIQLSQEAGQVVWYSHLFQNFPQFIVIHTVKGFGIVNKVEIDIFLELLLFRWSSGCWQFDIWFLFLFWNQLEHLEVHGSCIAEAWLGEFWVLLYHTRWQKTESLSPKIKNKARMPAFTTSVQHRWKFSPEQWDKASISERKKSVAYVQMIWPYI